jgi:N-acetylglucosaminyl-diphospho-decaprenol L-rhamnosyltransferase
MSVLTIIIVSYNAREDLDRCLTSLASAPPRIAHQVIVVDNASIDDSVEHVRRHWPESRLIALDENVGFARANNRAIRETSGDLVLLLNSDTIVPAGAVDRLVSALVETPEAAAAGPRLVDADGFAELSFGRMVSPLAELRQKSIGRRLQSREPAAVARLERQLSARQFPDWVSGACLMVRRTDAEAVGLLDERYFMYLEDVDFCAALRARGRRILFAPDIVVTHLRGRSRRTATAETSIAYRRSHLAFYEKHHPAWARILRWYLRLKGEDPNGRSSQRA